MLNLESFHSVRKSDMKHKKNWICCFCIVLTAGVFLWFAQLVLTPKYMSENREGALTAEYYVSGGSHDVLFLGDCEVYECYTPPTLWEEYGITSYIRGTPQQLIWQSYYLLEETLRYEMPKAVVFNVYAMRYGEPQREAYNRITLDGMRFSTVKLRAVLASMTEEESLASYLLPLLRYHSRWKEIGSEDFRYLFTRDTVSHNGYLMQTAVVPKELDIQPAPLSDPELPEICWQYLDRMRRLCERSGIELILVKAPTNFWGYYWYDEWEEQVISYAQEHALPYYNFIPLAGEIGLDWSTDTYDAGAHLNVAGAEKLTSYFGRILSEKFEMPDHRADAELTAVWTEKWNRYQAEKNGGTQ